MICNIEISPQEVFQLTMSKLVIACCTDLVARDLGRVQGRLSGNISDQSSGALA